VSVQINTSLKAEIMKETNMLNFIKEVLTNYPKDWLNLTTHRLDIYDEKLAKTQFLDEFEILAKNNITSPAALDKLPTAYDYIRLGHPLSCVLEWALAKMNDLSAEYVISFSSKTMPILAILRKNLFLQKNTRIFYSGDLPEFFDAEIIRKVYGYQFDLTEVNSESDIVNKDNGSTVFISQEDKFDTLQLPKNIDFHLSFYPQLGSILYVHGEENEEYISEIQHVRRRESIAMTPADSLTALQLLSTQSSINSGDKNDENSSFLANKEKVVQSIKEITATSATALVASSGLSIQYAIMMGLIDDALEKHPGKAIKFIVPPNCYGGTNDQARRVAACLDNVEVVDLPVDGDNDMVQSVDKVLHQVALQDAVPYIIAEIPTNPRVEVPDLQKLKEALSVERKTANGSAAIDPVFILDQTFCPNVHFLGENGILSSVRAISYASGSKFPSGGLCTAGYCAANELAEGLIAKIGLHLSLCDNEATSLQYEILAKQLPSMNERIMLAYQNTREFVNFIQETLPAAKINFVSEELAAQGFTPSVFSLDLPTKGNTDEEKEAYKRALNHRLIHMMITEIPNESTYCVSYGQLKGCYWTIPATSTQGTTKEGDKDYIARVAVSGNLDLDLHKKVFMDFVSEL
jgi:cystathionine beta-lyase/cystathionine gamma-synthase